MEAAALQYLQTQVQLAAFAVAAAFGFIAQRARFCTMGAISDIVNMGAWTRMRMRGLVVFIAMGFSAYATLSGIVAVVRVNTLDQVVFSIAAGGTLSMWLSAALDIAPPQAGLLAASLIGGGLIVWALFSPDFRERNHLLGGIGLGLAVAAMWWVSGHLAFVVEYPQTLEPAYLATDTGRLESLTFTALMAYALNWLILFNDASNALTIGVVSVAGVVTGAFIQSMAGRSFRWEGFRSTQDTALHLVGAMCMGVGGVTAFGCAVGQGMSGLSTLSLISVIAVTCIVLGSIVALRFQIWLLDRE